MIKYIKKLLVKSQIGFNTLRFQLFLVLQDDRDLVAYKVYNEKYIQEQENIYFSTLKRITSYRTFAAHNLNFVHWKIPEQSILHFSFTNSLLIHRSTNQIICGFYYAICCNDLLYNRSKDTH